MKIKTSELTGPALDWAVAKCKGQALLDPNNNEWEYCWNLLGDNSGNYYFPSSDWSQGGLLMERERISLRAGHSGWWVASILNLNDDATFSMGGSTPLIAAMRCFVASKLGEEVEIPEKLK